MAPCRSRVSVVLNALGCVHAIVPLPRTGSSCPPEWWRPANAGKTMRPLRWIAWEAPGLAIAVNCSWPQCGGCMPTTTFRPAARSVLRVREHPAGMIRGGPSDRQILNDRQECRTVQERLKLRVRRWRELARQRGLLANLIEDGGANEKRSTQVRTPRGRQTRRRGRLFRIQDAWDAIRTLAEETLAHSTRPRLHPSRETFASPSPADVGSRRFGAEQDRHSFV